MSENTMSPETRSAAIEGAAVALIEDIYRRYPGEELRCPLMRALEDAIWPRTIPRLKRHPLERR